MARNRVIKAARSAEEIVAKARARPSLSEVEAMQLAADETRAAKPQSMQTTSIPADWGEPQAEVLRKALEAQKREGTLGYGELAGFLFAVACAPELVKPSEWIPEVLGEGLGELGSLDEAQRVLNLVMSLHNHINREVLERKPSLPAGITVRADPMENFGPDAPLGQWARGYSDGQLWLEETWDAHLPGRDDDDDDPAGLGGLMMVLGFFASREFAESIVREWSQPKPLDQAARKMLSLLPDAMRELATLGRGIEDARRELARTPARSTKVGRNEPCPCGSGRKYKFCCGAA